MPDGELAKILATIVGTLLFTGLVYAFMVMVLVSLLVGVADLVARLGRKVKEVYIGYSSHGNRGHSVDSAVGVVRQQKRRLT